MDYSLLMVIEKVNPGPATELANRIDKLSRNEYMAHDQSLVYHVGIIDFLQSYSLQKKAETFLKTNIYLNHPSLISCVPPYEYKERFVDFVR